MGLRWERSDAMSPSPRFFAPKIPKIAEIVIRKLQLFNRREVVLMAQ